MQLILGVAQRFNVGMVRRLFVQILCECGYMP